MFEPPCFADLVITMDVAAGAGVIATHTAERAIEKIRTALFMLLPV